MVRTGPFNPCETQSFRVLMRIERKGAEENGRRDAGEKIGLHLFAWSRRDMIALDACRLCL